MLCIILILIKISKCFFFVGGGGGGGSKPTISCTLHSRLLPIFLTFSISHFLSVLSIVAYFLHVSPASHPTGTPTSLSFLSHLPYAYFPVLLTLYAPLLYSNVHQEVALKNLKRWKRPASNSPKWSRSLARTFCHRA